MKCLQRYYSVSPVVECFTAGQLRSFLETQLLEQTRPQQLVGRRKFQYVVGLYVVV